MPKYQLRTIHPDGRVDYETLPGKPGTATNATDGEMMLPAGFSHRPDGTIETPADRAKRQAEQQKQKDQTRTDSDDSGTLYPAGINPK